MAINREVERETDVLDQAGQVTELFVEAGRSFATQACAPETHPDFDGTHCVECDESIPDERLAMMRVRCVRCQGLLERRRKFTARG